MKKYYFFHSHRESIMDKITPIDEVIDNFACCNFNDATPYMERLKIEWEKQYDHLSRNSNDMKNSVLDDLKILCAKIKENEEKEIIILPETFDHKYGHWNSFFWIVSRWYWFMKDKNIVIFYWYILLADENKKYVEKNRMCKKLVDNILSNEKIIAGSEK